MAIGRREFEFAEGTLRDFIDSVALSRAIREHDGNHGYAFTIAQRSAFDEAVITWCILFGSDRADHQPIHWKNLFEANDFRPGLLKHLGGTLVDLQDYQRKLVQYRNDLVAHRSLNPRPAFHPDFDTALSAADYFHRRLHEEAEGGLMGGPGLMEQFRDRLSMCRNQMATAIAATRSA
jgi:hypothetical protein